MTASGAGADPASAAAPGGRGERALLLLGIVMLAISLRPAVTSLGAVLGVVRADLGISGWLAGVLTTLPVLCFAAVGALTHLLTHRLGLHRTALLALLAVVTGSGDRSLADSPALFTAGSAVALAGMAVGNVSLPPLVKLHFPDRIPAVTAVYSCALLTGAAIPAGLTVPVADASRHLAVGARPVGDRCRRGGAAVARAAAPRRTRDATLRSGCRHDCCCARRWPGRWRCSSAPSRRRRTRSSAGCPASTPTPGCRRRRRR